MIVFLQYKEVLWLWGTMRKHHIIPVCVFSHDKTNKQTQKKTSLPFLLFISTVALVFTVDLMRKISVVSKEQVSFARLF